ncbi:MAG: hypothetical protein JWQ72_2312 [Polaromonas sp.]|nr:hypothetical protein [Polaromonas sp.]
MLQLDDMLQNIEITDQTVVAALTALTLAEEIATLVRAETEMLEGETRQILTSNLALMETVLSSLEAAQATVVLAKRWHL